MKQTSRIFLFLFWLFPLTAAIGQVHVEDSIETKFFLRKELTFRLIAHSSGFGAGMSFGKSETVFRKHLFEFEFVNIKAPKEVKSVYPYADQSKSYVYGKLIQFYVLRGGFGYEKQLNRKPYWGGVEVRYLYHAGVSLGFAKPVYLYIINYPNSSNEYTLTTEKYDPANHFYDNIYGRAPFSYGLNEIKIHPGAYGKFGFSFDWAADNDRVRALEAGVIVDAFPEPVKIMAFNPAHNFFLTLYISLNLGKKYNNNIHEENGE